MIELTFIMGVPLDSMRSNFIYDLADGISEYTGGCTLKGGIGYWKPDAVETKSLYTAETMEEQAVRISVTVHEDESGRIMGATKTLIVRLASEYNLLIDWVHVQEVQIARTAHFSVKDEISRMNASQLRDIKSPGTRYAHS